MLCKTCYSIGRQFPLKIEKYSGNLYQAQCTNPHHERTFWLSWQWRNGGQYLLPVSLKPQPKQSYQMGDMIHYWDGQREQKIKKNYLEDIRSRAVTEDGEILRGQRGEKYNREHGQKQRKTDVIYG